ncbi:MAG: SprT family zinc-dependent metalloprotease [Erythrobacter sp.]
MNWLKRSSADRKQTREITPEIDLGTATLPVILRRHPTAKRLTLRLAPDGSAVRVTLPAWAPAREAIAFARSRADWLAEQLQRIPQRSAPEAGGIVQFRGVPVTIMWEESSARRPVFSDNTVRVGGAAEGLETRLRRWLEREALTLFESDMRDYCARAALDPVPVALSRAQKRWGSCSDMRRIRLNWRLVQAPDHVRRSVVAHEVTHLVHFDHSPAFHAMLAEIYEGEIREADAWLKVNGRSLYAPFG